MEWAAELWSENGAPLHIDRGRVFGMRRQGRRFSDPALFAGVTSVRNRGSRHPHWNCGVRFGNQCHIQPQTQRAVQGRTQLATERAGQAGARCATHRAIDCWIERGIEVRTDCGPEFLSLGAIDRRAESGTHRAADRRAKSLIDCHIDGGSERGLEPRGHPGIDSPLASASLRPSSGLSGRARSGSTRYLRDFRIRRQIST